MIGLDALANAFAADDKPVLISGPTASGKSALALGLAERLSGAVVNADALQVYADWRVLTARPSIEDEARAPHRLYGHVDAGATDYSVGRWLREVGDLLPKLASEGRRPIIVGGAGLYFTALTRGLADIPEPDPALRARGEAILATEGLDALLALVDPTTRARLDVRNPRRVLRAWEVFVGTGRGLADWARETPPPLIARASAHAMKLETPVERLDERIRARLDAMAACGALDEVRAVSARTLDPSAPAMKALGAREFADHLEGRASLDEALRAAALATRRFAKRQRTWMRNQMADWTTARQ